MNLPITTCPDGAGSINNPANNQIDVPTPTTYVAPEFCVGTWEIPKCPDVLQEQYAAENLNISGAPLNVFKLLGVHEQGKLIDLVGNGEALNGSANAFGTLAASWISPEAGMQVLTAPAWLGYDFGTLKTSYGQEQYAKGQPAAQHITSFRIKQPTDGRRALQVRVERSLGGLKLNQSKVQFTGAGNGMVRDFVVGHAGATGTFMLTANDQNTFTVLFLGSQTSVVGIATVGARFNCPLGSFTIIGGSTPFASGDLFSLPVELDWLRVDVVNLPDTPAPVLVRIEQSAVSRYWRLVPTSFSGVATGQQWEVDTLELFDYQATRLDDIQDQLFMENRDRDYSKQSISFKVSYQPFDAISDLSKFGFQISDTYSFTTVFSTMVRALGRPIVVGDILEVPSEMQYDQNLRPVRKFLEVTDTSWASDGYTTSWRPINFKFQATQVIASQENRDILGTADTQKYVIDDGSFFDGFEQIQTAPITATEAVNAEAQAAMPEKGSNVREVASGMSNGTGGPGTYDGRDLYIEDGLPPDGLPYTEGFKLPDVAGVQDGSYFRLNYDPKLGIASRLYRFNTVKNKWMYVETDRRAERNSMKPSQQEMFKQTQVLSLSTKKL